MTERGPIRQPDSVRGIKENGGVPRETPHPERPRKPEHLSDEVRAIFDELVMDAMECGIPTKGIDSHIFVIAAGLLHDIRTTENEKVRARSEKRLTDVLDLIGGTPKARLRMGIRKPTAKPTRMATILSMAK